MKLSLQLRLMLQYIEVVWRAAYISSACVINLNTSIPQWIRLHPNLPYYRELTCFVIDSNISRSWKCHLFENKRYGFSGSLWKLQNLIAFMGDFDLSHTGSILGKAIFPLFHLWMCIVILLMMLLMFKLLRGKTNVVISIINKFFQRPNHLEKD